MNVYVDVNGLWVTGHRGNKIVWELDQSELGEHGKGLKTWKLRRETEQLLTEHEDRAEWGTLHFTASSVGLGHFMHQQGTPNSICRMFATNRVLQLCFGSGLLEREPCKM